jgi:GrpB-like predicted nucleotidyltransferase (UPF0157 family)
MIGLEKGIVRIENYDTNWPLYFEKEKERLFKASGSIPLSIEHVGSTAINGLCAKPIIDILIGLEQFNQGFELVPSFEDIGYEFKGENGIPERHFFAFGNPRTYHLHVVEKNSEFWVEHILFRDRLRKNDFERQQYAELKRKLANEYPTDREKYTDSKAYFIKKEIKKAKDEEGGAEKNGL